MTKKKIKILDVARAARKLQEEKDGKREISDFSTPALRYFALGFESDYKNSKSKAGSASKKKQGIWSEVCRLRKIDPEMDALSLWSNLDDVKVDSHWELYIDSNRIYQDDLETGKTVSISFETFRRHYFSKAISK